MKPSELEAAGVDPDGFHEDPDAAVRGSVTGPGFILLSGGPGRERPPPQDRPSGVRKRTPAEQRRDLRRIPKPDTAWIVPGPDGSTTLCLHVWKVGCFLLKPDGFKRHRVFNLLTGIQHVTYGTEEEVRVEYLRQSESWKQKLEVETKHGSGWRGKHFLQIGSPETRQ